MMRTKYLIREKNCADVICGVRWDSVAHEILLGGPKKQSEALDRVVGLFEIIGVKEKTEETVDGYRIRIKTMIGKRHWDAFQAKLEKFYDLERVTSFRRLMG